MVLPTQSIADLTIRYTEPSDAYALREWLGDQDGGNGFPIDGELELSDAVIRCTVRHKARRFRYYH